MSTADATDFATCTSYAELRVLAERLGYPVGDDPEATERRIRNGIDNGTMTVNEIRALRGLPPIEGGDTSARHLTQDGSGRL